MIVSLGQCRDNSRLRGNRTSGGLLDAVGRDGAVSAQVVHKLDMSKLPPVVIAHNEARLLLLDGPRRREAAGGIRLTEQQNER